MLSAPIPPISDIDRAGLLLDGRFIRGNVHRRPAHRRQLWFSSAQAGSVLDPELPVRLAAALFASNAWGGVALFCVLYLPFAIYDLVRQARCCMSSRSRKSDATVGDRRYNVALVKAQPLKIGKVAIGGKQPGVHSRAMRDRVGKVRLAHGATNCADLRG